MPHISHCYIMSSGENEPYAHLCRASFNEECYRESTVPVMKMESRGQTGVPVLEILLSRMCAAKAQTSLHKSSCTELQYHQSKAL